MTLFPPPPTRPTPPLLSLQVLRAVAALLVVVHHAGFDADTIARRGGAAPLGLDRLFDFAFGIHLFFVISGFIMLRTARGFGSARGGAAFMARRVLRVVPLYWLLTTLLLLGIPLAPDLLNTAPGGFDTVLGSYLFIPVMRAGGELRPVLGQGWTLDYEMFFYLLFALAMPLPRRTALTVLALALVGLVAVGRLVPAPVPAVAVWTDGLLLEFLFGLILGVMAERGWRLGARGAVTAAVLGALTAVALGPWSGRFEGLADWARAGLPATAIVAGCVLGPRWRAAPAVLALALVGDASYSLYLSHPFVVRLLRNAWGAVVPATVPPAIFLAPAILAAVVAALGLYRWVERPLTLGLGRRSRLVGGALRPILPDAAAAERTGRTP